MAEDFLKRIEQEKLELARAYAVAAHGHSTLFLNGLLGGFDLTEEGKTTVYAPAKTPAELERLIPKLELCEAQWAAELEAEAGAGHGNEEPPAAIPGYTVEETAALKWLSTAPAPGRLNLEDAPAVTTAPEPTEEEVAEYELNRIKTLAAG
jgi:hypothetical protein